jgi:hypothetical protein
VPMRWRIVIALAALTMTSVHAETPNHFADAKAFIERYNRGGDILLLRMYLKGITDGYGFANAELAYQKKPLLWCQPGTLAVVEAQYVSIMEKFLQKTGNPPTNPPAAVLLLAMQDQFPCAK